jgi:hypothetical protein
VDGLAIRHTRRSCRRHTSFDERFGTRPAAGRGYAETTIETRKQEGDEQAWAELRRAQRGAEDQLAARRTSGIERGRSEAYDAWAPRTRQLAAKPDEPGDDGGLT